MLPRTFLRCFAPLPLVFIAGAAAALEPFSYPSTLLDAPATLAEPPASFLRIGKPKIELGQTTLKEAADFTGATRLREGKGLFARDYMCLTGTENRRAVIAWVIASGTQTVSEAQLEWLKPGEPSPSYCKAVPVNRLPFRLGKVGLGMTKTLVLEVMGKPSYETADGWSYWFSQRWLRNERNLQELELNWLGLQFEDGRVKRAFNSLVKNP